MKERDKALVRGWIGEIKLNGKPLRPIGPGLSVILAGVENAYVTDGLEPSPQDMVEVVMIMGMNADEIGEYIELEKSDRKKQTSKFAAKHIDEIDDVIEKVAQALERIGNALMESDNVGKEMRHAS